jgi:hypothetical protein
MSFKNNMKNQCLVCALTFSLVIQNLFLASRATAVETTPQTPSYSYVQESYKTLSQSIFESRQGLIEILAQQKALEALQVGLQTAEQIIHNNLGKTESAQVEQTKRALEARTQFIEQIKTAGSELEQKRKLFGTETQLQEKISSLEAQRAGLEITLQSNVETKKWLKVERDKEALKQITPLENGITKLEKDIEAAKTAAVFAFPVVSGVSVVFGSLMLYFTNKLISSNQPGILIFLPFIVTIASGLYFTLGGAYLFFTGEYSNAKNYFRLKKELAEARIKLADKRKELEAKLAADEADLNAGKTISIPAVVPNN